MGNGSFLRGVAATSGGALLWGFMGSCSQYVFQNYGATASFLTAVRAMGAAVLFAIVLGLFRRDLVRAMLSDRATVAGLAVFGVGIFGSQFAFAMVVRLTNAGTATVLQMLGSVFIVAFTCLFARRLPFAREALGLASAAAATWLIATQGDPSALVMPISGLAWAVLNGLSVALYVMWPKKLFARWGSFASTGLAMAVCGVLAVAAWLAEGAIDPAAAGVPDLDAAGLLVLVGGVTVAGTFAAFALYLHGVSLVGPVAGGLLGAFEPLGAMVVSSVWLRTPFSAADWAGFALMMAMLVLVTVSGAKDEEAAGARDGKAAGVRGREAEGARIDGARDEGNGTGAIAGEAGKVR